MKILFFLTLSLMPLVLASAQKAEDLLATANGLSITAASLSDDVRRAYLGQNARVASERTRFLNAMVHELLMDAEAKARGITVEALTSAEIKKLAAPTPAEIKTVFDANRAAFGDMPLENARPQIVAFLRNNAEQKALADLAESLKTKHRFAAGKDVNAPDLKPADTLFSVAGKPVTAADFAARFDPHIYDLRAEASALVQYDLDNAVYSAVIAQEAKTRNLEPGDLIAAEVTNKLRDFTDDERSTLEKDLKKRLYAKYSVKFLMKEPEPVAHSVSPDDDPVFGKTTAPVTIVMFSDFQCSACAATHPVLKKVIEEYGDKVRLVVRDFPLQTIHENAMQAALAANAARQQGKFFEYIEILYRNQEAMDAASLKRYASELGLNLKQFELDFSSEIAAAEVRRDIADGLKHGARGTPTIFVNGVKLQRLSAETFRAAIQRALTVTASK